VLIPQFSLRWLLGVMTASAGVFAIFGMAVRGYLWAAGVSAAIIALVVAMLVYAALFGIVWIFSLVAPAFLRRAHSGQSPFAQTITASQTPPSGKDVPLRPTLLE